MQRKVALRLSGLPFEGDPDQVAEAVKQLRNLNGEFDEAAKDLPKLLQTYATNEGLLAREATC